MFQWNTGCYFFWCCNNYHYISDSHCINITTYIFISLIKLIYLKLKKFKKKKKKNWLQQQIIKTNILYNTILEKEVKSTEFPNNH